MKKHIKLLHAAFSSSSAPHKMSGETMSYNLGGVTVLRSTRAGKDGEKVQVEVLSIERKQLARVTAKQIHDLVAAPITTDRRLKASQLAKKAKDAQESSVTAKFRRVAA